MCNVAMYYFNLFKWKMTRKHKMLIVTEGNVHPRNGVILLTSLTIVLYKVEKLRYLAFENVKNLEDNSSLINFKTGTMCFSFCWTCWSSFTVKLKGKKIRLNEYDPQVLEKFYQKELIRPALTTPHQLDFDSKL